MIIDITKTVLTPGNKGKDCLGNGMKADVECCCDECDYLQCCTEGHNPDQCKVCMDKQCPRTRVNAANEKKIEKSTKTT